MITRFPIIIILFSLTTIGCKTKKNQTETSEASASKVAELTVVSSDWSIPDYNVPATIDTAFITGDILTLKVSYSGGCTEHDFELVTFKAYKKSMPPQLDVVLVHNPNGESCRSMVEETLQFDIKDARYPSEKNKEVRLIIGNGVKGGYRLAYRYQ